MEYYFHKSNNKRNRAMIFELLINEKADIECEYGITSESVSIREFSGYKEDLESINKNLKYSEMLNHQAIKLLDEIYLTKHVGQKIYPPYSDMVLYTIAKIFNEDKLIDQITDLEKMKEKLETFKPFDKL